MKMKQTITKSILLALFACLFTSLESQAQYRDDLDDFNYSYTQQFYFNLDKSNIDETLGDNAQAIDSILYKLRDLKKSNARNIRIRVIGSASLEASDAYNQKLATSRSNNVVNYLRRFRLTNDVDMYTVDGLYDWTVLRDKVAQSDCPYRQELLSILHVPSSYMNISDRKQRIKDLGNGAAYEYIDRNFFRFMRYASIRITADVTETRVETTMVYDTIYTEVEKPARKFMVGVRTNLLYDAAAVPNIGLDVYLSKHISLGVNWMYAWWKCDHRNIYWRDYGGDVHLDYWFDPTLKWSGHHLGVYGQMQTFDFEWKKRGYQMPKWGWGAGLDYGYSFWLAKHLSLDLNIGVGYLTGKYHEYLPDPSVNKYYRDATKTLHWIGPTKAEVSLIWKIGRE